MNLHKVVIKLREVEAENARLRKALIEIKRLIEIIWVGDSVESSSIFKVANQALKMEPLGEEFEKVLKENLDDLYGT